MRDNHGRQIDYLRISITDRCNLRCGYCMPAEGVPDLPHDGVLRYEELLRIVRCAVELGIDKFKITGGEPLVRWGCADFIHQLKGLDGVRQVTLTTNGLLLPSALNQLADSGLDGVNISLDTLDVGQYQAITRQNYSPLQVVDAIEKSAKKIPTKVNAVLLPETRDQLIPLAKLAESGVDVRFIQRMPIGQILPHLDEKNDVLPRLKCQWPDLIPVEAQRGNGPARYYKTKGMSGYIGLIEAMDHQFCQSCNRIRLTSTGALKPCLCYGDGIDLRTILRDGGGEEPLKAAIAQAILQKPAGHCFRQGGAQPSTMNQIGG